MNRDRSFKQLTSGVLVALVPNGKSTADVGVVLVKGFEATNEAGTTFRTN